MSRNPVLLVEPGARGELNLGSGVRAHVVRGVKPGPIVWAWAPRGAEDPSMAQALGELRDRLEPARLAGAIGLLLDGPPPPLLREQYPWAAIVRAISDGADAIVLCESMLPGFLAAPHAALELDDKAARKIARALGAAYLTPEVATAPLDRALLAAPAVTWIDGESDRLSRAVIDRAARALRSLCATLGMIDEEPARPAVRVALKAIATVEAPGPGMVEPLVAPGALIRLGEVAALVGEPGLGRRKLCAPATGVVLFARAGQLVGGTVMGIGKLRRALPAVVRASTVRARVVEVGWCERVALPALGIARLEAKIDTGARTSALHVNAMTPAGADADGRPLLDIELPSGRRGRTVRARVAIVEFTSVRDSGGHEERRPVIETLLALGGAARPARITLTSRGDMQFPMLVGRTALGPEIRVVPTRRFLLDGKRS